VRRLPGPVKPEGSRFATRSGSKRDRSRAGPGRRAAARPIRARAPQNPALIAKSPDLPYIGNANVACDEFDASG